MGTSERKEREKLIRREDIIHAAEKVFFQKGYDQATMDEVAKSAEYSKRTLYSYFQSKEQLIHAVIFRAYSTLNAMMSKELSEQAGLNGLAKIKLLGSVYIRFMNLYPSYFELIVLYNSAKSVLPPDDEFRQESDRAGEETLGFVVSAIREGIEDKSIRPDPDIRKTAFVLYANIIGISNLLLNKLSYLQQHQISADELIEEMFKHLDRSIKPIASEVKQDENPTD